MTATTDTRYVRSDTVLTRNLDSALLLLPPSGGSVLSLTGAGTAIWRLLREPVSLDELVAELARGFAMPADAIQDDVRRTLHDLVQATVVRVEAA